MHGFGQVKCIQYNAGPWFILTCWNTIRVFGLPRSRMLGVHGPDSCFAFHILLTTRMAGCEPNVGKG